MSKRPQQISQTRPIVQKKPNFLAYNSATDEKGSLGDFVLHGDLAKEITAERLKQSSYEYVPFLNDNNNLFKEIFNALLTSPTNAAIIQKKVRMILGDSFTVRPKQGIVLRNDTPPTDEQLINWDAYLSDMTPDGDTINDVFYKVAFDFVTFGNAYIKIKKSKVGGVTRYYQQYLPFSWVRLAKEGGYCGVSKYWDTQSGRQDPDGLVRYPLFPAFEPDEDIDGVECSILHIKNHYPHFYYYGVPAYIAAVLHCELEYRIAKYNQSQFNNGFMPSAFMQVFGAYSQDEAEQAVKAIDEKYQGTGNNSKLILQVLSDPATAAKIDILQDIKEGSWLELGQIAKENIVTAHEFTQSLAGMATSGSLGTNQQMRAEFEVLQNTVIRPMQQQLLSQWLSKTMPQVGEYESKDFGNNELDILNNSPVSFSGDIPASVVLTTDEQREILGFEPLENQGGNDANID